MSELPTNFLRYLRTQEDPKMRPLTKAEMIENVLVDIREAIELHAVLSWAKDRLVKRADYEGASSLRHISETVLKPHADHPIVKARRHTAQPEAVWTVTTSMMPMPDKSKRKKRRVRRAK